MTTKYLIREIHYRHGEPDGLGCRPDFRVRIGAAMEVVSGPMPLVPGEGGWPDYGRYVGCVVATPAGHHVIVPEDHLSDVPPCKDCLEVQDGIDESGVCPGCREWAAMTPEQRAACFA